MTSMIFSSNIRNSNLLPVFPHVISLRIAVVEGDKTGVASVLQRCSGLLVSRRHVAAFLGVVD